MMDWNDNFTWTEENTTLEESCLIGLNDPVELQDAQT